MPAGRRGLRRLITLRVPVSVAIAAATAIGACASTSTATTTASSRGTTAAAAPATAAVSRPIHVVATGLAQPKKLSFAPNGSLLVAVSGDGVAPASCTDGSQPSCRDASGAIDEVSPAGRVRTLIGGLPSISSGSSAGEATGPAQARIVDGRLQVLFQDVYINTRTGAQPYGSAGRVLGDLTRYSSAGRLQKIEAAFGPYEAAHDPDHSGGSDVAYHTEAGVDSDPYAFVPYRGGYAVADAGGNDLLFVSPAGKISLLAVFAPVREAAPAGTFGSGQTHAITAKAQIVPDALAVGPDGALYVGALGGVPFASGRADVYRVVPGHAPAVYARGFNAIGDIAFDRSGRLLVLEIDQRGLGDPALRGSGPPASGAIIRVAGNRAHTTLISSGLNFPTGLAVAANGSLYVSDFGTSSPSATFHGGEIVRINP